MFKNAFKKRVKTIYRRDKNERFIGAVPIDQFNSQSFNLGANGLPACDITLLARSTSMNDYAVILQRLQENKVKNPDNKGKTDAQIIGEMMPSWVQTPSEIDRFVDWYNSTHPVEFSKAVQSDVVDLTVEKVEKDSVSAAAAE